MNLHGVELTCVSLGKFQCHLFEGCVQVNLNVAVAFNLFGCRGLIIGIGFAVNEIVELRV